MGVAASKGKGRLYAGVYSVAPAGVFVPTDSPVRKPEDLAGVPIAVGYQSGSHYSTIQALEQYMPADKINLTYADGMLFHRLDQLIEGKAQASALFSGPYYFAEQLGFRKIIDTTFMIATMVTGDPDREDLRKFFRALRRAQRDIDLRPDLYTHYYKREFPTRYHAMMDTRRWGPGERLVFETYTKRRSSGSPTTASSPTPAWAQAPTRMRSSPRRRSHFVSPAGRSASKTRVDALTPRGSISFAKTLSRRRWIASELGLARVRNHMKRRMSGKPDLRCQARQ